MISIITPVRAKDTLGAQWLHEAIASVHDQEFTDWEMIVVDDHSDVDLSAIKAAWPGVRWLKAKGQGVSAARNQAAEAARGELLLPLDADDKLAPSALEKFAGAWKGNGAVYSDVVMFGQDYARVYLAAEYSFPTLLKATFMTVGCLHLKSDWERIGGWRLDMTHGLEDWEYWIRAGELGICGTRLAEPLYWYRRHPTGRLAWLKSSKELWNAAYGAMRELHKESYAGRVPMGCCGGKSVPKAPSNIGQQRVTAQADLRAAQAGELVLVVYTGPRSGDFQVISGVTRTKYRIPGPGQMVTLATTAVQGVKPADVPWFLSVGGGTEFRVVQTPKAAPPVPVAEAVTANPNSEAWAPATMENVPLPEGKVDGGASRTKGR